MFSLTALLLAACQNKAETIEVGQAKTATEAYKMLYTAVKSKETDKIKLMFSRSSNQFVEGVAGQQKKDISEVYKNGLTATTFAEAMPEIRDERVKGNFAKVEVYNERDKIWEDLPFILEDGGWKLAVGDLWANTFEDPGPSKAKLEDASTNTMVPYDPADANNAAQVPPPANPANQTKGSAPVNTAQVKPETDSGQDKK